MRDRLKLISAAATRPVTLTEAKLHSRIDSDDEDDLLEVYLSAAVEEAERFTGRAFIDQTWDYYLDEFPTSGGDIYIPLPPLIAVTGLFYTDTDGAEQEFTSFEADTAKEGARLFLDPSDSWPTPRDTPAAVRIRFRAGYVNAGPSPAEGTVPADIKAAILMMFGSLYEHRETIIAGTSAMKVPYTAEYLLRQHRVETALG